jgi:enediyne biosynthesis protein E4
MTKSRADRVLQSCSRILVPAFCFLLLAAMPGAPSFPWNGGTLVAASATPSPITFRDVSQLSKFSYVTNNDATGKRYFPQPMCGGVAILDYDQDGKMDVFFTNGAKLPEMKKTDAKFYGCLLRNRGDGTFEDVTKKAGLEGADLGFSFGVAAGDYDNDGYPDLFIASAGRDTLYHNNGDGTFTDVTAGSGLEQKPANLLSVGAAWFDYDNDGLLDLVVSEYTYWSPELDKRCSMGQRETYCDPRMYPSVAQRLYHNLGHGKFEDVTGKSGFGSALGKGMGITIADFNGDGRMDVFIANDTKPNFLFLNQGDGTFKEVGLAYGVAYNDDGREVSSMGADAKDFNNDGWVDIFYNDLQSQVFALFLNQTGRGFRYVSPVSNLAMLSLRSSGWSNAFVDYDNDGWKDIYSANGDVQFAGDNARQHDTLWRNLDGKKLVDVSSSLGEDFLREGFQRGSAIADLNNDGFPDLVVTSLGERPRILMNSASNGNHWLWINTIGHRSNHDGIGARIKVTTPSGRTFYNHVTRSVGFMSSSDKRVHFGLGQESEVKTIEIRWPSGIVQILHNVKADQFLIVKEPPR